LEGDIPPQQNEVFEFDDPFDRQLGAESQIRESAAKGFAEA